jgi:dTDP-4-dehydrorhamnose reductase
LSTDLVYSGANPPYYENSSAVPSGIYGWSKLMGDLWVSRTHAGALIARTSVLFGEVKATRPTFSEALLRGEIGTAYVDCFRNHTPIHWLARAMLEAFHRGAAGVLLLCGAEDQSRAAFAEALTRFLHRPLEGITMGYAPPGTPRLLSLRPHRASVVLGKQCPTLQEGLEEEYGD